MADIRQQEDTPEFVPRRNEQLVSFFRKNGFGIQEIRIIGNENSPAILYKDERILNCHVHNFKLIFTDAPYDGKVIKTYRLVPDDLIPDVRFELLQLIENYSARKVYKVRLESPARNEIYLCGWNHLNQEEHLGKYPVFGTHKPKVFFNIEKAEEITKELNDDGYITKVI